MPQDIAAGDACYRKDMGDTHKLQCSCLLMLVRRCSSWFTWKEHFVGNVVLIFVFLQPSIDSLAKYFAAECEGHSVENVFSQVF